MHRCAGNSANSTIRERGTPIRLGTVAPCIAGNLTLRIGSASAGTAIALNLAHLQSRQGDVPATFIGLLAVAFYLSELVTAPFFGTLSDRYGRKRFMLLGTLLGMVAILALPWIQALPLFLLARAFEGLSSGSSVPAVLGHLAAETAASPKTRGRVMAVFEVATILGFALGHAAAGFLFAAFGAGAFHAILGIYGLAFLLFALVPSTTAAGPLPAVAASRHRIDLTAYKVLLRDRVTAGFLPAWIGVNAVLGVWGTHLSFQMAREDLPEQFLVGGFTSQQVGMVGAGVGVVFIIGTFLWTLAFGRLRAITIMFLSTIGIGLLCVVLAALNHSMPYEEPRIQTFATLSGLALLIASGFTPAALSYLAELSERFPLHRGSLMGLYSVLLGAGQLLGGWAGGFFAQAWAVDGLILLTVLLAAATMAGLGITSQTDRQPATPGLHTPVPDPPFRLH